MTTTKYPRYHLSYEANKAITYHTKRKKSFLIRLDRLTEVKGLKKFSFSVEYFKGGFNYSIDYKPNQLKEARKVAKIFTNTAEEKFLMS